MRNQFISQFHSNSEKEFWILFFKEMDKRFFVEDSFRVADFGCRINKHLEEGTESYSLMYTRNGQFRMNNIGFNGQKWDGLNRLKNWCNSNELAEQFYFRLNQKNLLTQVGSAEIIDIPVILNTKSPSLLVSEMFYCIDTFQ